MVAKSLGLLLHKAWVSHHHNYYNWFHFVCWSWVGAPKCVRRSFVRIQYFLLSFNHYLLSLFLILLFLLLLTFDLWLYHHRYSVTVYQEYSVNFQTFKLILQRRSVSLYITILNLSYLSYKGIFSPHQTRYTHYLR